MQSRDRNCVDHAEKQTFVYQHEQMIQSNEKSELLLDLPTQWSLEPSEFEVNIGLEKFVVQVIAPVAKKLFNAFAENWEALPIKKHTEMDELQLV